MAPPSGSRWERAGRKEKEAPLLNWTTEQSLDSGAPGHDPDQGCAAHLLRQAGDGHFVTTGGLGTSLEEPPLLSCRPGLPRASGSRAPEQNHVQQAPDNVPRNVNLQPPPGPFGVLVERQAGREGSRCVGRKNCRRSRGSWGGGAALQVGSVGSTATG